MIANQIDSYQQRDGTAFLMEPNHRPKIERISLFPFQPLTLETNAKPQSIRTFMTNSLKIDSIDNNNNNDNI